jgi:hypothetical protein
MARLILIDELHLTVHAPRRLGVAALDAMRRELNDPRLLAALRRLARRLLRRRPALAAARLRLSR